MELDHNRRGAGELPAVQRQQGSAVDSEIARGSPQFKELFSLQVAAVKNKPAAVGILV